MIRTTIAGERPISMHSDAEFVLMMHTFNATASLEFLEKHRANSYAGFEGYREAARDAAHRARSYWRQYVEAKEREARHA